MKRIALVCSVGLLGACAQANLEEQNQPAAGPTVSLPYSNLQGYRDAAVEADDYCAEHYGADAHPTGDYSPSGGEAVFICVSK
jgi:hypothetical protein